MNWVDKYIIVRTQITELHSRTLELLLLVRLGLCFFSPQARVEVASFLRGLPCPKEGILHLFERDSIILAPAAALFKVKRWFFNNEYHN